MPLDPTFTADWKPRPSRRRYEQTRSELLESFASPESVEMQLGRSDFRLGALQRDCPFDPTSEPQSDAQEWSRGWLAEKQIEVQNRLQGEKLNPPWKLRQRHPARDPKK